MRGILLHVTQHNVEPYKRPLSLDSESPSIKSAAFSYRAPRPHGTPYHHPVPGVWPASQNERVTTESSPFSASGRHEAQLPRRSKPLFHLPKPASGSSACSHQQIDERRRSHERGPPPNCPDGSPLSARVGPGWQLSMEAARMPEAQASLPSLVATSAA